MKNIWDFIKSIIEAFLTFFKKRQEEKIEELNEKIDEISQGDLEDKKEVDDVRNELRKEIDDSNGSPDAYESAFDKLRELQGDS